MSKVDDYTKAGYIKENPDNKNEVIFTISMRITKAQVEAGAFEVSAATGGWTPESETTAPEACIEGVKQFSQQQMVAGFKNAIFGAAQEQYDAVVNG